MRGHHVSRFAERQRAEAPDQCTRRGGGRSPGRSSLGDRLRHRPIVVAVTGEADGAAPVRVAAALEQRFGSAVSAVQVLDVSDLPNPLPAAFTFARELIGDVPYAEDARARRRQFGEWLGRPNEWPVHIAVGSAAYQILGHAERQQAALIVMGLRHHGVVDRVLRDETTLTVARRAHCAVMAVVPGLQRLPRRAIVGIDFGPASIRAARAALDVLVRPGADEYTGAPPRVRRSQRRGRGTRGHGRGGADQGTSVSKRPSSSSRESSARYRGEGGMRDPTWFRGRGAAGVR